MGETAVDLRETSPRASLGTIFLMTYYKALCVPRTDPGHAEPRSEAVRRPPLHHPRARDHAHFPAIRVSSRGHSRLSPDTKWGGVPRLRVEGASEASPLPGANGGGRQRGEPCALMGPRGAQGPEALDLTLSTWCSELRVSEAARSSGAQTRLPGAPCFASSSFLSAQSRSGRGEDPGAAGTPARVAPCELQTAQAHRSPCGCHQALGARADLSCGTTGTGREGPFSPRRLHTVRLSPDVSGPLLPPPSCPLLPPAPALMSADSCFFLCWFSSRGHSDSTPNPRHPHCTTWAVVASCVC